MPSHNQDINNSTWLYKQLSVRPSICLSVCPSVSLSVPPSEFKPKSGVTGINAPDHPYAIDAVVNTALLLLHSLVAIYIYAVA